MRYDSIIQERNEAIKKVYSNIIKASNNIGCLSRQTIISLILESPAPRFYITPFTARLYINKQKNINSCRKKEMIDDLIENYNRLKKENPNAPKEWLYKIVVEQPAKSFYMSAHRIEEIIFNYTGRNGR